MLFSVSKFIRRYCWNAQVHAQGCTPEVICNIEAKWLPTLPKSVEFWKKKETADSKPFYSLAMFPYPSGALHMGHARVYTASDAFAWRERLRGRRVIHPIGWDAFGLPAENAAKSRNLDAADWTLQNVKQMKSQLLQLGLQFDWEREISTCQPNYYKWTQWLFVELFKSNLAYQKWSEVSWDPIDKTVLADEQIDASGHSWRSGALVEKRHLLQWHFRIPYFANALRDSLNTNLPNWDPTVKKMQTDWIGDCNGLIVNFTVTHSHDASWKRILPVFTEHPHLLSNAHFVQMSSKNSFIYENELRPKDFNNLCVINPHTQKPIPLIVDDEIHSAGIHDQRDAVLGLPSEAYFNSIMNRFSLTEVGQNSKEDIATNILKVAPTSNDEDLFQAAVNHARKVGYGDIVCSRKSRDWIISRQRHWGTPIPIIHCKQCGPQAADELPITIPNIENKDVWLHTKCPKCGGDAIRESDTMDTFVDSSWYFLRYLDPHNDTGPFDSDAVNKVMPVDIYFGGVEHARMHLYFARFIMHFLQWKGYVKVKEPVNRLVCAGTVLNNTFYRADTEECISLSEMEKLIKENIAVKCSWQKMSKSKHNGIDPLDEVERFGVDLVRAYMLDVCKITKSMKYDHQSYERVKIFRNRLWLLVGEFLSSRLHCSNSSIISQKDSEELHSLRKKLISNVDRSYEQVTPHYLVFALHRSCKHLRTRSPAAMSSKIFEKCLLDILIMSSIVFPLLCSELWNIISVVSKKHDLSIGTDYRIERNVLEQNWPKIQ